MVKTMVEAMGIDEHYKVSASVEVSRGINSCFSGICDEFHFHQSKHVKNAPMKIPHIIKYEDKMYIPSVGCVVRIENAISKRTPVRNTPTEM